MLSLASSYTFPIRRADSYSKIMIWEALNMLFMLNLQLHVALLLCSMVHEFNTFIVLKNEFLQCTLILAM